MLYDLKQRVFEANQMLPKNNLVTLTWGNVSEISKDRKYIAIKPSGVNYEEMTAEDIVLLDIDGNIVEGDLKPSTDTPTHLEIYRKYPEIRGICHTHSRWATIFAQGKQGIEAYGTTHADYFYGKIPITRDMTKEEIDSDYEKETGKVIIKTFEEQNISPSEVPAILVASHGPFTMGTSACDAVSNAIVLEEIAFMAYHNELKQTMEKMSHELLDKHYLRKHGKDSYYGQ